MTYVVIWVVLLHVCIHCTCIILCITHFTLYRFSSSLPSLCVYFSVEFVAAGVDLSQPVVATCGSGVTAAHIALAAHTLGADIPVYDVRYSVHNH